jgi:uncharacterized protein (UPF0548 family)
VAAVHLDDLAGLPLTYTPVGATRQGVLPEGYHHVRVERRIGVGRRTFEQARDGLMAFAAQRGAGLRPRATAERAAPGVDLLCLLGVGPLALAVPCRVVWTVEEDQRAGFGYGTLAGHVESGEEAFVVELRGQDVYAVVLAYSVPVSRLFRLGGPVTRSGQRAVAQLYLRALARAARD